MEVQLYTRFNRPLVSGLTCLKPSMTSQEFKDECNVNNILKRYAAQAQVMGVPLSELLPKLGTAPYGDFTNLDSFMEMKNKVARATQVFESLPSDIRAKYGNTVEGFIGALNNPDEYKFLSERGVLNKGDVQAYFDQVARMHDDGKPKESAASSAPIDSSDKSDT